MTQEIEYLITEISNTKSWLKRYINDADLKVKDFGDHWGQAKKMVTSELNEDIKQLNFLIKESKNVS